MHKLKVLLAFGTRPEAIKMAPLVKVLQRDSCFDVKVLVTAQHREMLDQVLDVFKIVPDFDLNLMAPNQSLSKLAARILTRMDDIYSEFHPDLVLVHGDTLSAFVVSQSAFYNQIDVGHVEAGLRTYNLKSPWPEEGNRQLISRITQLHFAPTNLARECLLKEGIEANTIFITGNTVIDALLSAASQDILPLPKFNDLSDFNLNENQKIILITGHRRENFGKGFENICLALKELSIEYPDIQFVYPVHLNPNVELVVKSYLSNLENVLLIPPQSYLEFINLMKHSYIILTDSGGIQEEAPSLGVPVLVMRDTTERQEAVDAGTVKLIGTNKESIVTNVKLLLEDFDLYKKMVASNNPYGDGTASQKIADAIKTFYQIR